MNQRNRLISNSIINMGSVFVSGALQIILVPVLLLVLKDNGLGIVAMMATFHTYSRLLDIGFSSAIDRYIPQHLIRNEIDQINTIINTSIAYFTIVMMLIGTGTVIIAYNFTHWFNVAPDIANTAIIGVSITGVMLACRMPFIPYGAVLISMQRYDFLQLAEIGLRVLRSLAILSMIWFLSQQSGLLFVIVLNSMDPVLTSLIHYQLVRRHLPGLKIRMRLARWACFRKMIGYGVNTFLYMVGILIITESSILIILHYLSDTEAGRYAIPLFLIRFLSLVVAGFTQGIKPAVSKLEAEGNFGQIRQVFLRGSRYANLLVLPTCLALAVLSKLLLFAWVGPLKADLWPILSILALGFGAFYTQYAAFFVMAGLGHHIHFGVLTVIVSILSVLLSVGFLTYTGQGLIGVALGTALPVFCGSLLVIPLHTCRSLGIPLGEYVHFTILKPLYATVPFILLCGTGAFWGLAHPLVTLVMLVVLGAAVLGCSIWKVCLTDAEKVALFGLWDRSLPSLRLFGKQFAR